MTTQQVLEKYFKEEKILFFQQSDYHHQIEGDTYLRYAKNGKIEIWMGGNNGEVCVLATTDPEKIETLIKAIIF